MKKNIIITLTLLFLVISLTILFLFKEKDVTIHQLKKRMKNTTSIYVCEFNDALDKVCDKDNLIKIITDKKVIDDFITIVQNAEEETAIIWVKDQYTLYLVNDKNEINLVIDYDPHLTIRLSQKEVHLSTKEFELIEKIVNPN